MLRDKIPRGWNHAFGVNDSCKRNGQKGVGGVQLWGIPRTSEVKTGYVD